MANKKMLPVLGLLMVLAGAIAIGVGARQEPGIRVPPGAIVESPNAKSGSQQAEAVTPGAPALPAANGTVAYTDSFDGALSGWTVLGNADSSANWVTHEGRLEIWGDQDGVPTGEPSVLANQGSVMTDGTFQVYVYPTAGEPVGVVFRGSDAGYYRLDLFPNLPGTGTRAALHRVDGSGGQDTEIAKATSFAGYEYSSWQLVSVTTAGDRITAQVNGQTILEATDSAFTSGWTGVWTSTGFGAQFDNARLLTTSR